LLCGAERPKRKSGRRRQRWGWPRKTKNQKGDKKYDA